LAWRLLTRTIANALMVVVKDRRDHIQMLGNNARMAFKLIESAQARWRAINAPHLVALVRAGARFEKGKLVERPDESEADQQVA
jgi:hypothetical protein